MKLISSPERDLYLYTIVDSDAVLELTKSILNINKYDKQQKLLSKLEDEIYKPKPIKIYIDSYGGYIYQCNGLLGMIEQSKTPIHTIAVGAAMSAAFTILISGHKRFAYKYAVPMYHEGSCYADGTVTKIEENLKQVKVIDDVHFNITIDRTKITKKKLKKVHKKKKDWYFTAETALKYGVIDEIINQEKLSNS